MATVIIVILLVVICIIGINSYRKKLSHGCCGAGGDDERKIERTEDLSEYKYKYAVKIGGMTCKNCALRIENALNRREGIYAQVDLKNEAADVYSKAPVSEFTIRQTVVGLGYSVESLDDLTN